MSTVVSEHDRPEPDATLSRYVAGFVGSIAITLTAYLFATHHTFGRFWLITLLALLAILQFIVQMVLFLHVDSERGPRWKLAVMCMMLGVVLILVFGSLWIMDNLNYRMTPQQVQQYLKNQDTL